MDHPASSTLLQSSEIDVVMQDNDNSYAANGTLQNGFMDPRDLHSYQQEAEPQESHEDDSTGQSQTSNTVKRQFQRQVLLPTGCCYDDRMKFHANSDYSENAHHPEDPRRIEAIMTAFRDAGLIYAGTDFDLESILKESPTKYMWRIPAREARRDEICLAHTPSHYEWVRELGNKTAADLRAMTESFDSGRKSLYVSTLTYFAALISAGGAIESCKRVVEGQVKNAIAVIRPPGHHAEHNESMGFCIFNNVPIAAKVCMQDYPDTCRKVLILDWDVHHGNGVQNIFYDDPNVLYISIHVYQDGIFYPGRPDDNPDAPDGGIECVGTGAGIGKNVNIGWHGQGMGDGEYVAAFQRVVMPIAQEFNPDLVIVSAGFDAAAGDELGGCYVSPACYSHMTHMLMSLADGKVAVCLEGGYNLHAISKSALAVTQTLMGEPPQRLDNPLPPINIRASRDLEQVRATQSRYWACMRPGIVPVQDLKERSAERLSAVTRIFERSVLSKKYNMITMPILRNRINKVFENQVLVTSQIHSAKRILLLIRDPPEIFAQSDFNNNSVASQNGWMTTDHLPYIDWAIENGFGVIDVNFPKEIPQADNTPWHQKPTDEDVQQQSKDLLSYLWDNHLQLIPNAPIALMGIGDAYLGIKQLLTSRDVKYRIPCVLAFVTGSLRPVKSETDPELSSWYKMNSLIFVSSDHSCWNDEENAKRVRKSRFGAVQRSEVTGLGKMLNRYQKESSDWLLDKVKAWEGKSGDSEETDDEDELSMTGSRSLASGHLSVMGGAGVVAGA